MNTRNLIYRNHNLTLTGNVLGGDTYPIKDAIKSYMGGKWDGTRKAWIVDVSKVDDLIKRGALNIACEPVAATISLDNSVTGGASGWCNKCHSYCYGDCHSR